MMKEGEGRIVLGDGAVGRGAVGDGMVRQGVKGADNNKRDGCDSLEMEDIATEVGVSVKQ